MIEKTINGVTMKLRAACFWGELCDVAIIQDWINAQGGDKSSFIEMSIDEAEALIIEIQAAITEARRCDREYSESQMNDSYIVNGDVNNPDAARIQITAEQAEELANQKYIYLCDDYFDSSCGNDIYHLEDLGPWKTSDWWHELEIMVKRMNGTHSEDCLSQYPLPTGMGNWHCTCGARII